MTLSRVKWRQNHTLGCVVLDNRILCRLQLLLKEWVVTSIIIILLLLIVVLEITNDFLFFVVCEHFNLTNLQLSELHPWIEQNLLRCEPLIWVSF